MTQATCPTVKCEDCPTECVPKTRNGKPSLCEPCKHQRHLAARRQYRANNPPPRAPQTRPCRNEKCSNLVQRSGKVYPRYCSDDCKPKCSVEDCTDPKRKNGLCASHASQLRRTGEAKPFTYKWSRNEAWDNCGRPTGEIPGLKKYCSWPCATRWNSYGGKPPTEVFCVHCGLVMSLELVDGRDRRRRADTKICRRCRQDLRKYGMTVGEIAARDGTDCKICDQTVDMSLRAPDPGCPSVDHRIPRSRGGTNDPANLQLAHLRCNILKHDRLPE